MPHLLPSCVTSPLRITPRRTAPYHTSVMAAAQADAALRTQLAQVPYCTALTLSSPSSPLASSSASRGRLRSAARQSVCVLLSRQAQADATAISLCLCSSLDSLHGRISPHLTSPSLHLHHTSSHPYISSLHHLAVRGECRRARGRRRRGKRRRRSARGLAECS